ncbi:hypothetical protein ACH5RR_002831 [Cinchona calisaya]|uniref:Uncharacterized protein n=1 Tax=Cinchona calisaya TaxID=153742 RepID=A0ABD3AT28_9GENT
MVDCAYPVDCTPLAGGAFVHGKGRRLLAGGAFVHGKGRRHRGKLVGERRIMYGSVFVVLGDFNDILCAEEKKGGRVRSVGYYWLFKDFVAINGLSDVGYSGYTFTWSGSCVGEGFVDERLDRVLITTTNPSDFDEVLEGIPESISPAIHDQLTRSVYEARLAVFFMPSYKSLRNDETKSETNELQEQFENQETKSDAPPAVAETINKLHHILARHLDKVAEADI